MKKVMVAAVFAVALAILAANALGSANAPNRAAAGSLATKSVTCGKTRTIGMAAPITGPAADIGNQQVRWAKFFVKRWNASKTNRNQKIQLKLGDTQLGVDTAFAVKVAKSFKSNSKLLAVVGPAGSQEVVASTSAYKAGGLGFVSGSATRVTLTDGHTDGNRRGYFFRDGSERRPAGPDGRQLHDQEAEVEAGLHHRRPGDLLAGPGRRGAEDPQQPRASRRTATRSARPLRTSRRRSRRSRATTRASTSPGSLLRRPRPSASSCRQPARATSSCSARTACSPRASGRSRARTTRPSRTTLRIRSSRPT